tara:strand:- start:852 stop:1520 length:669 start_codon:yes stop_codon:yes gene_type:complete
MSFLRGKKVKRETFTKQTENEKAGLDILNKAETRQDVLFDPLRAEYAKTESVERTGQTTGISNADYYQSETRPSIGTVMASDTSAGNAVDATSALIRGVAEGQTMETKKDLEVVKGNEAVGSMLAKNTVKGGVQAAGAETAYQSMEADRQLAKTNAARGVFASAANQMASNVGDTGSAFKKSYQGFTDTGKFGEGTMGIFGTNKTPIIAYDGSKTTTEGRLT